MKISLFGSFYSNIARVLENKWIHEGVLFIAWILILSHNEKYIKVSENSVKNFLDTHPPLIHKYAYGILIHWWDETFWVKSRWTSIQAKHIQMHVVKLTLKSSTDPHHPMVWFRLNLHQPMRQEWGTSLWHASVP